MKVSIDGVFMDTDDIQLIDKVRRHNSGMWFTIHFKNKKQFEIYYPNEVNLYEKLTTMRNNLAAKWGLRFNKEDII